VQNSSWLEMQDTRSTPILKALLLHQRHQSVVGSFIASDVLLGSRPTTYRCFHEVEKRARAAFHYAVNCVTDGLFVDEAKERLFLRRISNPIHDSQPNRMSWRTIATSIQFRKVPFPISLTAANVTLREYFAQMLPNSGDQKTIQNVMQHCVLLFVWLPTLS
jgi:hypothetical protein